MTYFFLGQKVKQNDLDYNKIQCLLSGGRRLLAWDDPQWFKFGKIRHKITSLVLISQTFFKQVSADLISISGADCIHFTFKTCHNGKTTVLPNG